MDAERLERKRRPPSGRILDKIKVDENGCWEWQASRDPNGYGRISMRCADGKHRPRLAHRVSYTVFAGEIPEGLTLDHVCRNTSCVNPDHLEPVTIGENSLRAPTSIVAIHAAVTHCPQGHPYDGVNTLVRFRNGRRRRDCRACARERMAKRREAAQVDLQH